MCEWQNRWEGAVSRETTVVGTASLGLGFLEMAVIKVATSKIPVWAGEAEL